MSEPRLPRGLDGPAGLLALLHRSEPLKHLPRTGWVDRDVAQPESVAAHSWRLALMAWLAAEAQGIDAGRAVILALVHDLAEAVTGDITPFHDGVRDAGERRALAIDPPAHEEWRTPARRAEKLAREREAMGAILQDVPDATASLVRGAWEEYEEGSSAEARLVRQLDRLEAYMQGREYAADGRLADPESLNSFRLDCERSIHDPPLRALLAALEGLAVVAGAADPGGATPPPRSDPEPAQPR